MKHEIVLGNCMPYPLASYLKGIGVFRLVSHVDTQTGAAWDGENLTLRTRLSHEALRNFFMVDYVPTPICAPWNAGSGFYFQERKSEEKDPVTGKRIKLGVRDQATKATKIVDAILASASQRLDAYRTALRLCRDLVDTQGLIKAPEGSEKNRLMLLLRGSLPDDCLEWIDAAVLIASEKPKYPPLLGTGGNDGNLDISSNFMQRLLDVMDPQTGASTPRSGAWLDMSLFGEPAPALVRNAIGQYAPDQVGGPNAAAGFEGAGGMNPWDFVLMIEGALAFAAAVARRNAQEGEGVLSCPFTVRTTAAGAGTLGAGDAKSSRGELWMPLWSRFASYAEIRALFAEGRVALGRRPARDALDFVRAVHRLGSYRGVDRFQRFGLLMRSGKAYLATSLEQIRVIPNPQSAWIDELERGDWLSRFRRFAQGKNSANRFITLRKRLEDALFDFARRPVAPARIQALLTLLGEIQSALAVSAKARESVGPVPTLSARWAQAADDGTPAYRIARALASLRGEEGKPLPLRAQLFPVHPRSHAWIEAACAAKGAGNDPACRVRLHARTLGNLVETLTHLLERRLWLAKRLDFHDSPLNSDTGIGLEDLDAFLRDARMDRAIAALLPGLALCHIPPATDQSAGGGAVPAAFGLLKLALTPDAWLHDLAGLPRDQHVPVPTGMVSLLASGNRAQVRRAVETAWRRLCGSGLVPVMPIGNLPDSLGFDPHRLAAALLIPLTYGATGLLARSILNLPETTGNAA